MYFGIEWQGVYIVFNAVPFGYSLSGFAYQEVGNMVISTLRNIRVWTSRYVDDIIVGVSNFHEANSAIAISVTVITELGYSLSEKSVLRPTQRRKYLGLIIDTKSACLHCAGGKD
jgi:hypothetical protein